MSRARMFMDCHRACAEADSHTLTPGCVGHVSRLVVPVPDDRLPDQLDVQVSMAMNIIRREANDARHRLGLEPRNYDHVTADTVWSEGRDQ